MGKEHLATKSEEEITYNLTDLDIDEISLVPAGANRKTFVLRKEQSMFDVNKIMENTSVDKALENVTKGMEPDAAKAVEAIAKIADAFKGELPVEEIAKYLGVSKAEAEKPAEEPKPEEKPAEEQPKADAEKPVEKAVAEIQKAAEEKIQKLQKELDDVREQAIVKEYVEKAGAYSMPGMTAADLGPVLRAMEKALPTDHVEKMRQSFSAVTEMVKKLGTVIGNNDKHDDANDPQAQIEKEAEKLNKEHPELSREQCLVRVVKLNREVASKAASK